MKIGLSLYTLREYTARDFDEVLGKVKALGYDGVEFAGYGDVPADVMKGYLEKHGLEQTSCHVPLPGLLGEELDKVIEYNKAIGNKNIVCAWAPMANEEEFQQTVASLKEVAAKLIENGMQLYYHNHAHEFEFKHEGKSGFECMMDDLFTPEELRPEADMFWVWKGGACPVDITNRYGNRTTIWHMKDGVVDDEGNIEFRISGQGCVGFDKVVEAADKTSIEWLIVENDMPKPEGYYVVGRSADYFKEQLSKL